MCESKCWMVWLCQTFEVSLQPKGLHHSTSNFNNLMTLLELAHFKKITIQALCEEIRLVTGREIVCKSNTEIDSSIAKKVAPNYSKKKEISVKAYNNNSAIISTHRNKTKMFKKNNTKSQQLSIKDNYSSLAIDKIVDVIIVEIIDNTESRYIKVKYKNLLGVIFLYDLFWCRVSDINNHLKIGETIKAKVISKETNDGNYRVRFSHKEFTVNPWSDSSFYEDKEVQGSIVNTNETFFTIKIDNGIEGRLYQNDMTRFEFESLKLWKPINGDINLLIKSIDKEKQQINLYIPTREDIYDIWDNIHEYYEVGKTYKGNFISRNAYNLWVQLEDGIEASVNNNEITWKYSSTDTISNLSFGKPLNVLITNVDKEKRKIFASLKQITPNPWDIAKAIIKIGDVCKVRVVEKQVDALIVETLDSLHLIGKIKLSEISWFPLSPEKEPQIGWLLEAKIILFIPEKFAIQFSIRQLQDDPWNNLYQGATVDGEILEKIDDSFLTVRIHNGLVAKTSELDLVKYIGETFPFKIVNFNRASQEIIVNHLSLITDKQNEEIIKSFFNSSII